MAFVNFYWIVVLTFVTLQPDPVGREQCVVGGSSDYGSKEKDYSDLSDKSDRLAVAACVPAASPPQPSNIDKGIWKYIEWILGEDAQGSTYLPGNQLIYS